MIKKILTKLFNKRKSFLTVGEKEEKSLSKEKQKQIEEFKKAVNQKLSGSYHQENVNSKQYNRNQNRPFKNRRPAKLNQNQEENEGENRFNRQKSARGKNNKPLNQHPRHQGNREADYQNIRKSDGQNNAESRTTPTPAPRISEKSVFNSNKKFAEMEISIQLSDILTSNNFIHPSKAQEQTIPTILKKKNLICSSETGSGKTLAFVIPILERFLRKEIDQACILTPTREIAIQIESVIKPLSDNLGITTGLAIGGMDMLLQKKILREYPQLLIATPGRLVDVSSQGLVWLNYCSIVVLDEVDRMLDMGFDKEISTLFELFPSTAQILMFTATMTAELKKLSQNYIKDYELITIGETMKTKASIEHLFLSLPSSQRYSVLQSLLKGKNQEKVLVFFNSIDETIKIFKQLKKDRLPKLNCLHSRKSQDERNQVMSAFRSDRINHLLTTDVLARGIDIPNIDVVINYDLPRDSEDYVHRIGRTGRADFLGKALSFVNKKDELKLKKIKQLIKSDQGFNFIGLDQLKNF